MMMMMGGSGDDEEEERSSRSRMKGGAFPTRASDYHLLEEIGRGAFAVVYRAICKPLDLVVAVKRVDLETCNGSLESVGKEAHFMSLVDHPNVMKAYCSFNVDHFLWVVMPYMDGGSCLHIMKVCCPDGLDESLIAVILKETLKGLHYLHQQQLIHRDIKAGNILIGSSGSVKLGDFGTSAYMFGQGGGERVRKTFTGTPCWMAPEVMEQTHGYDFRADIWSFGITALELAHGHAPFSKYPPMKVLLMTIQNAPPTLDHDRDKRFSKAFREMVKLCLNKDPSQRPTTEKLLKHPFFKHAKSDTSKIQKNLHGLGPLWEREKMLRDKDVALLASKKPAYLQEEERSRVEYKRGVSCWNFDVESLKLQAAVEDDEDSSAGEEDVVSESSFMKNSDSFNLSSPKVSSPSARNIKQLTLDTKQIERKPWQKQPKQIGRFGVFEGDLELESPGWHEIVRQTKDVEDHHNGEKLPTIAEHNKALETPDVQTIPLVSRELDDEIPEEDLETRNLCSPGKCDVSSNLDLDEWVPSLGLSENFEVTMDNTRGMHTKTSSLERSNSGITAREIATNQVSPNILDASSLPVSLLVPHLKNLLLQTAHQYETLADLLKFVNPGEMINVPLGDSVSAADRRDNMEISVSAPEKHDQIIELQKRVTSLTKELLSIKYKNFQLERQLNAIYNRHEEESIRREEAEKEYI